MTTQIRGMSIAAAIRLARAGTNMYRQGEPGGDFIHFDECGRCPEAPRRRPGPECDHPRRFRFSVCSLDDGGTTTVLCGRCSMVLETARKEKE